MIKTKKRINISVSKEIDILLSGLAHRDQMPLATKALDLIKKALETEEDVLLEKWATERDGHATHYLTHEHAWK